MENRHVAGVEWTGLARAARVAQPLVLFVLLPLLVALLRLDSLHDRFDTLGFDFRGTLWEPAGKMLDGASPYPGTADGAIASGNPSVSAPADHHGDPARPARASTRR